MLGVKTCRAARTCCAGRAHWRSASQSVRGPGPARRYGMQGLARWLHAWRWRTWQCLVWPPTRWGALLWRHMVYCNIPNKFWSKCIDLWTSTPKASLKYLPFNSYPCCQIKLPVINWTLLSEINMKFIDLWPRILTFHPNCFNTNHVFINLYPSNKITLPLDIPNWNYGWKYHLTKSSVTFYQTVW